MGYITESTTELLVRIESNSVRVRIASEAIEYGSDHSAGIRA